jgi:hypothetical protein
MERNTKGGVQSCSKLKDGQVNVVIVRIFSQKIHSRKFRKTIDCMRLAGPSLTISKACSDTTVASKSDKWSDKIIVNLCSGGCRSKDTIEIIIE